MPAKRKQRITPRAILEIRSPGEVHISPDAARVAFTVDETDWDEMEQVQHLWVAPVLPSGGGGGGGARQVTHAKAQDSYPRWSADGKWLAFLRTPDDDVDDDGDDDGAAKAQVWILPMDGFGGEAEKLTDASEGVETFDWLPDSSGVAYITREARPKPLRTAREDRLDEDDDEIVDREERFRQQVWRIDVEHKKPTLVYAGDYGLGEIAVSPDGELVAYSTNYTGEPNDYHKVDIWTVPINGGEPRRLTDGPGGKFHPVWSPDGSRVYYATTLDPEISYSQEKLYSVARDGGPVTADTADFPHDLTGWHGFQFDHSGTLYVTVALGTTTAVYRRTSGRFEPLLDDEEHIQEFSVAKDGTIAYVSSAVDDAPEVFVLRPGSKKPVAVSDLNGDWMDDYDVPPVDLVSWKSNDGLEIEGMLTYPPDYVEDRLYPTVVSLHGGPHGRVVQSLLSNALHSLLAAEGFLVFAPNYRGSEGYGNEFSTASRGDLGGADFDDVLTGIDLLVDEGLADPDRLGIIGSSYGGYLVNWAIARTKRFKAAVSAFGIFSFFTDFSNSEAPRWESEYLGGAYWEIPDEYHKRSPSTYARDIDTPVLILHGDDDPNTFVTNSHELYNALRLQGKTAQFVRYPREGHGFFEPNHRMDELDRCRAWFEKYLRGESTYRVGDRVEKDGRRLTVVSADVESYGGIEEKGRQFVEVRFVLQDLSLPGRPLTLTPADVVLSPRNANSTKGARPVGLSIDVLGQKSLAEASAWRLRFQPDKSEPGPAAAVALAFRVSDKGGEYALTVLDFPPVIFDVPAVDRRDGESGKPKKA